MTSATANRVESETDLVTRAQSAISNCNWEVGECAAVWTKRFARGRTDADFAQLVGLSPDQVYQRRRVWETFGDVYGRYAALKWSHFYAAVAWDDAAECLQWAEDIGATVAEMKAWRRAQRGEDLSEPSEESGNWFPSDPVEVRAPDAARGGPGGPSSGTGARAGDAVPVAAGVARTADGDEYAPFRDGAVTPASSESKPIERPAPTVEQLVRRMTTALERCVAAMDGPFRKHFADVPIKDRRRFLKAIEQLADKTAGLD
jgi:hypothetical protein